jgi:hypothetical protein
MRCAVIEADIREEVMREMEERMASMEKMYARRLMNEVKNCFGPFILGSDQLPYS